MLLYASTLCKQRVTESAVQALFTVEYKTNINSWKVDYSNNKSALGVCFVGSQLSLYCGTGAYELATVWKDTNNGSNTNLL